MRKLLSAFLALSLLAGCGGYQPPEDAEQEQTETEENNVESNDAEETAAEVSETQETVPEGTKWAIEFPASGFVFCVNELIADESLGEYEEPSDQGELEYGQGVILATCEYLFRTKEERDEYNAWADNAQSLSTEEAEAKMEEYLKPRIPLLSVFAVNGGRDFDDIRDKLISDNTLIDEVVEIGENNGFQYYYGKINLNSESIRSHLEGVSQEQIEDYKAKADAIAAHPEWFVFVNITPDFVPMQIGTKVSFTAEDLNGNEISSEDLFSQNEVNVVNVWRTWCGVCASEFPDLQEIQDSYGGRVGFVTYCNDALDADRIETAKSIVGDYNFRADLRQSDQLDEYFKCQSTPYTYFLDSSGTSLCYPISGADLSRVRNYIDRLLNGEQIQDVIEPPSGDQQVRYMVLLTDQDNNPVEGAMISFCTDVSCDVVRTDAKGAAYYTGPKQYYHVHIVSVPSGYSFDDDGTANLDDESNSIWLVIAKE